MDLYRLNVFAHIVFAILLVGLALFWLVMHVALGRLADAQDATRLLDVGTWCALAARVVPYAWRLPLPWLTWVVFLVLCGTGILGLAIRGSPPQGPLWLTKLALVGVIALIQSCDDAPPAPRADSRFTSL